MVCVHGRLFVYVNKMDKNLSSVNPHEFIAFCNFPEAREKPDEKSFLLLLLLIFRFFLFLFLFASKIQSNRPTSTCKKWKFTQHKAFQLQTVQVFFSFRRRRRNLFFSFICSSLQYIFLR